MSGGGSNRTPPPGSRRIPPAPATVSSESGSVKASRPGGSGGVAAITCAP